MIILYFSATGNSLYVAKQLGNRLYSIPQMIKENKYEFTAQKIGIVFPLYEWSVNSLVETFLQNAKFNTNYLFAITTYGIYSGGIASHLLEISKKYNHNFVYINKIKMVDNYLPGFNMEKQIKNEHKKYIDENIEKIKSDIEQSKHFIMKESFLRKKGTSFMVKNSLKHVDDEDKGIKKNVYVENTCIKCGICKKVCPVDNIIFNEKNEVTFLNKCFKCYSCLHNCPKNSIHLKNEVSRARYRNKNISLDEIIQSNK